MSPVNIQNLPTLLSRVRSIGRAFKRGRITMWGSLVAKRPFNNRANTCTRAGHHSRFSNMIKRNDYERAKRITSSKSIQ